MLNFTKGNTYFGFAMLWGAVVEKLKITAISISHVWVDYQMKIITIIVFTWFMQCCCPENKINFLCFEL